MVMSTPQSSILVHESQKGSRGNDRGLRGGHNGTGSGTWRGTPSGTRGQGSDDRETHKSQQNSTQFVKPTCALCSKEDHPTFRCPELKNYSKEDLIKKSICEKCLRRTNSKKHMDHGCNPNTTFYVCKTHNMHYLVCKCPCTVQNKTDTRCGALKGSFFQRKIIFNTEHVMLETKSGETVKVVLNYDSWASDSSVSYKLQNHLHGIENEGNLMIQQYGSVIALLVS